MAIFWNLITVISFDGFTTRVGNQFVTRAIPNTGVADRKGVLLAVDESEAIFVSLEAESDLCQIGQSRTL